MPNSTNTGGGPMVGGNVETQGGSFVSRDQENRYTRDVSGGVIINFDDPTPTPQLSQQTLVELLSDLRRLIILVEGNAAYGSIGMQAQIRTLQDGAGRVDELSHRIDNSVMWNRITMALAVVGLTLGGLALWIH